MNLGNWQKYTSTTVTVLGINKKKIILAHQAEPEPSLGRDRG